MKSENAMLEYIREEPRYVKEIVQNKAAYTANFVKLLMERPIKRVYFSGSGSPHIAGRILALFFKKLLRVEASCEPPAILNNHEGFNGADIFKPEEKLLICPTQTGRTTGPIDSARLARKQGIAVVSVTLNPNGLQAKESDIVILKPTGPEDAFPESKGFVASLAILMLCALDAAHALGRIDDKTYSEYISAFNKLPESCEKAYNAVNAWFDRNEGLIAAADSFRFVGYGMGYYVVQEAMLKLVECIRRPCMPFETEEYIHGNVMEMKEDSIIFFVSAESGKEQARLMELLAWCRARNRSSILLCNTGTPEADDLSIEWDMMGVPYLNAIELLIPFQVIAHRGALATMNSTLRAPYPNAIDELHGFHKDSM